MVSWARKNGYRNAPFNNFRCPPKKPLSDNLLSQEELAQVVKAIDSEYIGNLPIRLVLRSISSLGLGVKEALRFSLNRVDFDRWEYIQDDVSWATKTNSYSQGHEGSGGQSSPNSDSRLGRPV